MAAENTAMTAKSPRANAGPPWLSPTLLIATGGGLGRAAVAPGTMGSILGVPLALATGGIASWAAGSLPAANPWAATAIEAAVVAAICLAGIPLCTRAARLLGGKDPGAVVFDEIASYPLAILMVPVAARTATTLAVALVLLRVFDISKPFPCRQLERLPAGLGIMADDWGAAAWTAACLAVAQWQQLL